MSDHTSSSNTSHLIQHGHHLEHGVIREVLESKLSLTHITWVCLPQHSMAVARDNLSTVESFPEEVFKLIWSDIRTKLLSNFGQPHQHFLEWNQ